jgi:hypothetical protein
MILRVMGSDIVCEVFTNRPCGFLPIPFPPAECERFPPVIFALCYLMGKWNWLDRMLPFSRDHLNVSQFGSNSIGDSLFGTMTAIYAEWLLPGTFRQGKHSFTNIVAENRLFTGRLRHYECIMSDMGFLQRKKRRKKEVHFAFNLVTSGSCYST